MTKISMFTNDLIFTSPIKPHKFWKVDWRQVAGTRCAQLGPRQLTHEWTTNDEHVGDYNYGVLLSPTRRSD